MEVILHVAAVPPVEVSVGRHAPPLMRYSKSETPTLSAPVPDAEKSPDCAGAAGEVIATLGAVLSSLGAKANLNRRVTVAETLPALSSARSTTVFGPLRRPRDGFKPRLQEVVPDAAIHGPPFTDACTSATLVLSVAVPARIALARPETSPPAEGVDTTTPGISVSMDE